MQSATVERRGITRLSFCMRPLHVAMLGISQVEVLRNCAKIARPASAEITAFSSPGQSLGVEVDMAAEQLRLTDAKRERYAKHARRVAGGGTCALSDYQELMGRLTFAASFYHGTLSGGSSSVTHAVFTEKNLAGHLP